MTFEERNELLEDLDNINNFVDTPYPGVEDWHRLCKLIQTILLLSEVKDIE